MHKVPARSLVLLASLAIGILAQSPSSHAGQPGTVVVWGTYYNGQTNVPVIATNIVAISGGWDFMYAVRSDGDLIRWGADSQGKPIFSIALTNVLAISANATYSDGHATALMRDRTVITLSDSPSVRTNMPSGLSNVISVAAGGWHNLALLADGSVAGWDDAYYSSNAYGQVSIPADLTNAVAIAGGGFHSLALRANGTVTAWGYNQDGECNVPGTLTNVVAISAGSSHNLALRADGRVVAWGNNQDGECNVPANLTNVVAIAACSGHSGALRSDGTVVAWGNDNLGQTDVPLDLTNVIAIARATYDTVALVGSSPPSPASPLIDFHRTSDSFSVSVPSRSGRVYRLEYKNSLVDDNWLALPLVSSTGGILTLTDSAGAAEQRFYRVREW